MTAVSESMPAFGPDTVLDLTGAEPQLRQDKFIKTYLGIERLLTGFLEADDVQGIYAIPLGYTTAEGQYRELNHAQRQEMVMAVLSTAEAYRTSYLLNEDRTQLDVFYQGRQNDTSLKLYVSRSWDKTTNGPGPIHTFAVSKDKPAAKHLQ